ncbi:ATP-binding protein, partial [Pseudoalteromonas spongiae]|uniref:ATP-binding protein n=1 Tax=Pseudoalteromonas spongiae TaxID=298657 RepID=UPI003736DE73
MQTKILPSRQALVDRIELQFAYGNNFICLISEVGLGKSYLAETFISEKFTEHNKAYVKATRSAQDRHLIGQILEQSFSNPLIDYDLTIVENFIGLTGESIEPLLIVIDDAHFISDDFANELFQLTESYQGQIRILLTATRQLPVAEAINMHIEALDQVESLTLMKMYFSALPSVDEPIFKAFIEASNGNPQLLLAWKKDNSELQVAMQKRSRQYKVYLLLICILILIGLLTSLAWYFFDNKNIQTASVSNQPTTAITIEDVSSSKPVDLTAKPDKTSG